MARRIQRTLASSLVVAALAAAACSGGSSDDGAAPPSSTPRSEAPASPQAPGPGPVFREDFAWEGEPAATVGGGGRTVHWDPADWDVRNDTHSNAVTPQGALPDGSPAEWRGHDISVHKAASDDPRDHGVDDTDTTSGGDGSPGIGVMHIDFQDIASARLRNPMVIGDDAPGVVSFYAPQFVTDGHWWEVAVSPADRLVAPEYTAVPGRQDPDFLNDPLTGAKTDGSTNGPGHRAVVEDSINLISTGYPDVPACPGQDLGWFARYAITSAIDGTVEDHVNPKGSLDQLQPVDPRDRSLHRWSIAFQRGGIDLYSDVANDGSMTLVDHWDVGVPWDEVYVSFLFVAYQGDHHPNTSCVGDAPGITQAQDTAWRDIEVAPVKYATTDVLPRDRAAWTAYDLRDLRHHGAGDPNPEQYDKYQDYLYCSLPQGPLLCADDERATTTATLTFALDPDDLRDLARIQLLADVRYPGTVTVELNGRRIGDLPRVPASRPPSPSGDVFEPEAWQRKGLDLPLDAVQAGSNTLVLHLDPATEVEVDRLELEVGRS